MVYPVIDFHTHVFLPGHYHPWVLNWAQQSMDEQVEDYLARYAQPEAVAGLLKECGVNYAVVLAEMNPVTAGTCTTEEVLAFCRGFDCLIPFASVNPYLTPGPADMLAHYVELGCRGLKLYPSYQFFYPNDNMLYPLYARAEELQIPVMFHTGSSVFRGTRVKYADPVYLDDIAVDFPDLVILAVHSGRGLWYEQAFFLAQLHRNVYLEISGLPLQNLLQYFPRLEKIADKIVFGSDWPGIPLLRENIQAIKNLPLREDTKSKI
jgi:hypothetical protein